MRGVGHSEWLERLQAEAGNLAAAVEWYLAHDTGPLPHLFRVLWLFWELRDRMGEARAWVERLLPAADSLDPQARCELLWTAAVTATEVGDDGAALAARQRLAPLLAEIDDPHLQAVSQLAMAWSSPIVGDFDGALREASVSLEQLRGQEEPYWTAVTGLSAGYLETSVGRLDDALRHLREAHDLAERFHYDWLAAWSRVQLGTLAITGSRLEEARTLLDEGLELSLAVRSTRNVGLYLPAFAQLALVEGDAERAALLVGAAEGLRQRVGLRAWPMLRPGEAELVAQIREALGADRFEELFAAGARLNRREAVAALRDRGGAGASTMVVMQPGDAAAARR
jgi:tetratricopeptide (TPR) repeat protein